MSFNPITLSGLKIPDGMGVESGRYGSDSNPMIIHIQNAHALPQAQRRIEELIRYFHKYYGVTRVAVEGIHGPIETSFLRSFPDTKVIQSVMRQHVEAGELSGVLPAVLQEGSKIQLFGVEDEELYIQGVSHYLKALRHQDFLHQELTRLSAALKELKMTLYGPAQRDWDARVNAWHHESKNMMEMLEWIFRFEVPDASQYPVLNSMYKMLHDEKKWSSDEIRNEIKHLAKKVRIQLSDPKMIMRFNAQDQAFSTESMGVVDYAQFLMECVRVAGDLEPSGAGGTISHELQNLLERQAFLKEFKTQRFENELDSFLKRLRETIFISDQDKVLADLSESMLRVQKLIDLELNRKEWGRLNTEMIIDLERIKQHCMEAFPIAQGLQLLIESREFLPFLQFYRTAVSREDAFVKNISAHFTPQDHSPIILISGGFHESGISKKLLDGGISSIVVLPWIDQIPNESAYRDLMQGRVSWRNFMQDEKGMIDLEKAFYRALTQELLKLNSAPSFLRSWRDNLIRLLSQEKKISQAHRWTPYLDEKISALEDQQNLPPLKSEWQLKLNTLIQHLEHLRSKGYVRPADIQALLLGSLTEHPYALPFGKIPAWWVTGRVPFKRSEVRQIEINGQTISITDVSGLDGSVLSPEEVQAVKAIFLQNAFRVADTRWNPEGDKAKHQEINRAIGEATQAPTTVNYWRSGKRDTAAGTHHPPTIGWVKALKLASYVTGESNGVKAIGLLLGYSTIRLRDLRPLFGSLDRELSELATPVEKKIQPKKLTKQEAGESKYLFLKNLFKIIETLGLRQADIARGMGVGPGTLSYWRLGKLTTATGEHHLPSISWETACLFVSHVLDVQDEAERNQWMAALFGDKNLKTTDLKEIFLAARQKEAGECVVKGQVIEIQQLGAVDWSKVQGEEAARLRDLIVRNAFSVADARWNPGNTNEKRVAVDRAIGKVTGATTTVGYWRDKKHQDRYRSISWEKAEKLAKHVTGESDTVQAFKILLGNEEIQLEHLAKIFRDLKKVIDQQIQKPSELDRVEMDRVAARAIISQFLKNSFAILNHFGFDKKEMVARAGYGRDTAYYLEHGKVNKNRGWEQPGMRLGRALKFSQVILGMNHEWQALARLMGDPQLTSEKIEHIFEIALNGKVHKAVTRKSVPLTESAPSPLAIQRSPVGLKEKHVVTENGEVMSVGIVPGRKRALIGTQSGEISLYQPVTNPEGEIQRVQLLDRKKTGGWVLNFGSSSQGDLILVGAKGQPLRTYEIVKSGKDETLKLTGEYRLPGWVLSSAIFPDGTYSVVGTSEQEVRFYRSMFHAIEGLQLMDIHHVVGRVTSVAVMGQGSHLLVGTDQGKVYFYRVIGEEQNKTLEYVKSFAFPSSGGPMAVFPDGKHVVITDGGRRYSIQSMETDQEGEEFLKIVTEGEVPGDILSVAIHPAGRALSFGGTDHYYRLYEIDVNEKGDPKNLREVAKENVGGWVFGIGAFSDSNWSAIGTGARKHHWYEIQTEAAKRSELRQTKATPWLTQLNSADWSRIPVAHQRSLVSYLFHDVAGVTLDQLVHLPVPEIKDVFRRKLQHLGNQNLASLYEHYEKLAVSKSLPFEPIQYLLFQLGFVGFEGFEEVKVRYEIIQRIGTDKRGALEEIKKDLQISHWIKLFSNNENGLWELLRQRYPSADPKILHLFVRELFLDYRKESGEGNPDDETIPFTLEDLKNMEPVLGKLRLEDTQVILMRQITHRIMSDLLSQAESGGADGFLAMRGVHRAEKWFEERLQGTDLVPETRSLYEQLQSHYEELRLRNYQQYINTSDSLHNDQPLELELYQLEGIHFLVTNFESGRGALLGDEMGVGKTVQILTALRAMKVQRAVIVAPKAVVMNWDDVQIPTWIPQNDRSSIAVITSQSDDEQKRTPAKQLRQAISQGAKVILMHYDLLKYPDENPEEDAGEKEVEAIIEGEEGRDQAPDEGESFVVRQKKVDELIGAINEWKPELRVADEAHRLRNITTDLRRGWNRLSQVPTIHLSGTPLWNHISDLGPLLCDFDPATFPDAASVQKRFPDNDYGHADLNAVLQRHYMLRRRQVDVMPDVPTDYRTTFLPFQLTDAQKAEYDHIVLNPNRGREITDFTRLRLLTLDTAEHRHQSEEQWPLVLPPALEVVMTEVRRIMSGTDDKIVILGEFNYPIDRLEKALREEFGEEVVCSMRQSQNRVERKAAVDAIRGNPKKRILLSTRILSEGYDLDVANHMFLVGLPMTPGDIAQRIGRLLRPKQRKDVNIYYPLAEGTLDYRIWYLVQNKARRFNQGINGNINSGGGVDDSMANDTIVGVMGNLNEQKRRLAELQKCYARSTPDNWNSAAPMYDEHLEEFAAFPIEQGLLLHLIQLNREGKIDLSKIRKVLSAPWGPATKERAWHAMRQLFQSATGMDLNQQFQFSGVDFSPQMRERGLSRVEERGMRSTVEDKDLTEDELPTQQFDLVDSSELYAYMRGLNHHGVRKSNWMLAQLVNAAKVDGYVQLWIHSGVIKDLERGGKARQFLREHFGVEVVDAGRLEDSHQREEVPAKVHRILSRMSFVLLRRVTTEVPIFQTTPDQGPVNLEKLRELNMQTLEMKSRYHQTVTIHDPEEIVLTVTDPRNPESLDLGEHLRSFPTASLVSAPAIPLKVQTQVAKKFEELFELLKHQLDEPEPTQNTIKIIQDTVTQIQFLDPNFNSLSTVYELMALQIKQQAKWSEEYALVMSDLLEGVRNAREEAALREGRIPTRIEVGDPGKKKKPADPRDPPKATSREGKEISHDLLRSSAVLAQFLSQGIRFKETEKKLDAVMDEKERIFWVPASWVMSLDREDLRLILDLKVCLHLDTLHPQSRAEAALVGLDAAQKIIATIQSEDFVELLERMSSIRNPEVFSRLFSGILRLKDLPSLKSKGTPEKDYLRDAADYLAAYRNNSVILDLHLPFQESVWSEIQHQFQVVLVTSSKAPHSPAEQKLIEHFLRAQRTRFEMALSSGSLEVSDTLNLKGDIGREVKILLRPRSGKEQELAVWKVRRNDMGKKTDPEWQINWKIANFSELEGQYQSFGISTKYGSQTGTQDDSSETVRIDPEVMDGMVYLIEPEDPAHQSSLLLKRWQETTLLIFELDSNQTLSRENSRPIASMDLTGSAKGSSPVKASHSLIEFSDGKILIRQDQPGIYSLSLAQANRSEMRIFDLALGLDHDQANLGRVSMGLAGLVNFSGITAARQYLQGEFDRWTRERMMLPDSGKFWFAQPLPAARKLDSWLNERGISSDQFQDDLLEISEKALGRLVQDIKQGKITRMATVIFYTPEIQDEIGRMIAATEQALAGHPELNREDFVFHVIGHVRNAAEKMDFLAWQQKQSIQGLVFYAVDGSEADYQQLSQSLKSRVFSSDRFLNSYGIYFPPASFLAASGLISQARVVRTAEDVPFLAAMAVVPDLARFYAETPTSEIKQAAFWKVIPDYAASLQFIEGAGIQIQSTILDLLSQIRGSKKAEVSA